MPRRIDRVDRRSELAEAVWRVILTQGLSAVSMRSVAAEAGVVVGSLRHVLPTRTDLLVASAEHMVEVVTERVRAARGATPVDAAVAALSEVMPFDARRRAELEVNIALIAEGTAEPALLPSRDAAHAGIASLCESIVETLAGPDSDPSSVKARRLHALVDGLSLQLLHAPAADDPSWAREVLAEELGGLTTGRV